MKELARLASRAILYRLPGLALDLQAAGNRLGDALDEEEMINLVADIPYTVFPCPVEGPALSRARNRALSRRGTDACLPRARRMRCGCRSPRGERCMQQCLR